MARHEALSEWQIKNIHKLVLSGIDQQEAARYRQENVLISGTTTIPPDHLHLNQALQALDH